MSCTTTVRLTEDERKFLEEKCISLTKLVRSNIRKLKETDSELYVNNVKAQTMADRLNDLGYTQSDGTLVESTDIKGVNTNPGFIGYSTICAEN